MTKTTPSQLADLCLELLLVMDRRICVKHQMPLPFNQFITLVVLFIHGPFSISEIASRMNISKQQMSPIINRMLADGYIQKRPSDKDKRSIMITLTDKAQSLLDENRRRMSQTLKSQLHSLSSSEIDELSEKLGRCLEIMSKV